MIAGVRFHQLVRFVVLLVAVAAPAAAQVRIVQTNSAGDNIHLIDPSTQAIVGEIKGVPINHGAAADPDGRRFYISSEAEQTLHVVDGKTLQTTKKIPLTGRPNNISIAKDGSRVYVGIVSAPGAVDVIDTKTLENVKSIPTKGGIHNVYVTPDGKHVIAGSIAGTCDDGHRSEDRRAAVDAVRGRCPSDGVRGESGRIDQADLRADLEPARLRDCRLRAAEGSRPRHAAR